jgi:hypothetical protein
LHSVIDKEISHGEDYEKQEEGQSHKNEENGHLYMFKLWESYKNALPSLFAHQGSTSICVPTLWHLYERSSARLCANGG